MGEAKAKSIKIVKHLMNGRSLSNTFLSDKAVGRGFG
jgi:hypothetical protein